MIDKLHELDDPGPITCIDHLEDIETFAQTLDGHEVLVCVCVWCGNYDLVGINE